MFNFDFFTIVASIPGLIMAMVGNGYARACVAVFLGDDTPRYTGRNTLNPFAHIDPIGMIMLFLLRFGWAKPLLINPSNFRHPRRDSVFVALSGPAANILIAFLAFFISYLLHYLNVLQSHGLFQVLSLTVLYNINFAVFNLLPIPPLAGATIVAALLPAPLNQQFQRLGTYGFWILLILIYTPFVSMVLIPAQRAILTFFNSIILFI